MHGLRGLRDKMAEGSFVIVTSLLDRLGMETGSLGSHHEQNTYINSITQI